MEIVKCTVRVLNAQERRVFLAENRFLPQTFTWYAYFTLHHLMKRELVLVFGFGQNWRTQSSSQASIRSLWKIVSNQSTRGCKPAKDDVVLKASKGNRKCSNQRGENISAYILFVNIEGKVQKVVDDVFLKLTWDQIKVLSVWDLPTASDWSSVQCSLGL